MVCDHVRSLTQGQLDETSCPYFAHQCCQWGQWSLTSRYFLKESLFSVFWIGVQRKLHPLRAFGRRSTRTASQLTSEACLSSLPIIRWRQAWFCALFPWCLRLILSPPRCLFPLPVLPRLCLFSWRCAASLPENSSWQNVGMFASLRNPPRATDLLSFLFWLLGFLLLLGFFAYLKIWGFTDRMNVLLWAGAAPRVSLDTEIQASTWWTVNFKAAPL